MFKNCVFYTSETLERIIYFISFIILILTNTWVVSIIVGKDREMVYYDGRDNGVSQIYKTEYSRLLSTNASHI